jgi:hypothetical protein
MVGPTSQIPDPRFFMKYLKEKIHKETFLLTFNWPKHQILLPIINPSTKCSTIFNLGCLNLYLYSSPSQNLFQLQIFAKFFRKLSEFSKIFWHFKFLCSLLLIQLLNDFNSFYFINRNFFNLFLPILNHPAMLIDTDPRNSCFKTGSRTNRNDVGVSSSISNGHFQFHSFHTPYMNVGK